MTHKLENISGYDVHFFDDFEEAHAWLKKEQGPKAQFISYISRQDVFRWTTEVDKTFDGKQYLPQDLLTIVKNKDDKALLRVHPEYFLYLNADLPKEDREFLAKNFSLKQLQRVPRSFLSRFTAEDLEIMAQKVSHDDCPYYKVYTLKKKSREEKTTFVSVSTASLYDVFRVKIDYKTQCGIKDAEEKNNAPIDFSKKYLTAKELAVYLGISVQHFRQLEAKHKDGDLYKMLGPGIKEGTDLLYKTSDFKKFMRSIYVTKTGEACDDESRYLPKDGIYTCDNLIDKFGVYDSVTIRTLKTARYSSTISYFKVTGRYFRYSYKDFKEFVEQRADSLVNIRSCMVKNVIQFPKDATETQKNTILNQFIDINELAKVIPFSAENTENVPQNVYNSAFMKMLIQKAEKYKSRIDDKTYFKKSDVANVLKDNYGYYGTFVQGENPIEIPYPIDFFKLYDYMKKGDKERGALFPTLKLIDYLSEKYEDFPKQRFTWDLNRWILHGKVPVFFLTKRNRQVYIPHLEECKEYQNFIKNNNLKQKSAK